MIESPILQELIAERTRETLINFLVARFGSKAKSVQTELQDISDESRLQELVKFAATCRTLSSFRKYLALPVSSRVCAAMLKPATRNAFMPQA